MRSPFRNFCIGLLALTVWPGLLMAQEAGEGLRLGQGQDPWPQWQARWSIVVPPMPSAGLGTALPLGAARLAGDHYFQWGRWSEHGGLRATSALLLGQTQQALSAPSAWNTGTLHGGLWSTSTGWNDLESSESTAAYLGVGYSAWWPRNSLGLSADLGWITPRPEQLLRLQHAESIWRSLQPTPVFQVHLSYTF